jgi:ribonuclease D
VSFHYADRPEALEDILAAIGDARDVALDTEFERIRTYYPKLCLVQLAVDGRVSCIDALAIEDLGPLWQALSDSRATKVLHSGRQDLELIHRESCRSLGHAILPRPLIDTQIAAGLLGIDEQISYAGLVDHELGISLPKGQTRTDWTRRPLTEDQLEYAADDVRHLVPMWRSLERRLEAGGRREWVAADCAALTEPSLYEIALADAWRRVKGARRLPPRAMAVLKRLAEWREVQAMKRDKPRQWIVKDETLMAIAEQRPADLHTLEKLPGMPRGVVGRYGRPLLELIAGAGDAAPADDGAMVSPPTIPDDRTVRRLLARVRKIAEREAVCPSMLATRREIERLVLGRRDVRLLEGWRRDLAGADILSELERTDAPGDG